MSEEIIEWALRNHPQLHYGGWGFDPETQKLSKRQQGRFLASSRKKLRHCELQAQIAHGWLSTKRTHNQVFPFMNSTQWAGEVSTEVGEEVSHGAFLAAALFLGFRVEPTRGCNTSINIDPWSVWPNYQVESDIDGPERYYPPGSIDPREYRPKP